jgi:hypothetical protein
MVASVEGVMRKGRLMTAALLAMVVSTAWLHGQTVTPPAGYPALGASPIVAVQSTGAEPRRALRYAFVKGQQDGLAMDMTMGLTMDMAGMSMPPIQMPTMHMVAKTTVSDVSASGDASVAVSFSDVSLQNDANADPTLAGLLQSGLADMKNLTSTSTVSPRGFIKDSKMDLSRLANPQMAQMAGAMSSTMNSIAMPMPEEAVGVGAKWTVRMALPSNGLNVFQEVQVELTALDAQSATLTLKTVQTAPPQAVQGAGLPAGLQASLDRFEGTGTGGMTIRFGSVVPTSTMNSKTNTTMSVDAGSGVQQISVAVTVKAAVGPVK